MHNAVLVPSGSSGTLLVLLLSQLDSLPRLLAVQLHWHHGAVARQLMLYSAAIQVVDQQMAPGIFSRIVLYMKGRHSVFADLKCSAFSQPFVCLLLYL